MIIDKLPVLPGSVEDTDEMVIERGTNTYKTNVEKIGDAIVVENVTQAVTDWLNENIPTGETVVVDTSLSIEGAAADAKQTGNIRRYIVTASETQPEQEENKLWIKSTSESEVQVPTYAEHNDLKSALSGGEITEFEQGFYNNGYPEYNTIRIRTKKFFLPKSNGILIEPTNQSAIVVIWVNGVFDGTTDSWGTNTKFYTHDVDCEAAIVLATADRQGAITPADKNTTVTVMSRAAYHADQNEEEINENLEKVTAFDFSQRENCVNTPSAILNSSTDFVNGRIYGDKQELGTANRLVTKDYLYLPKGTIIKINSQNDFSYEAFAYPGMEPIGSVTGWISDKSRIVTITRDVVMLIQLRKSNDASIDPSEADFFINIIYSPSLDIDKTLLNSGIKSIYGDTSEWKNGVLIEGVYTEASTAIFTPKQFFVPAGSLITIDQIEAETSDDEYKVSCVLLNKNMTFRSRENQWNRLPHTLVITEDSLFQITLKFSDGRAIDLSDIDFNLICTVEHNTYTQKLSKLKVLAIGDSLCYGYRNNFLGFIGQVGCQYSNRGVSGATISMSTNNNIPTQLITYAESYDPDAVVALGFTNDLLTDCALGTVPERPIDPTLDDIDTLDKNTTFGALSYLFYKMIDLCPKAQRYFIMNHHLLRYDVTRNQAGWNQTEFYEGATKICKMYGVKIIDVFAESPINTRYATYKAPTQYGDVPKDGTKYWVDNDGVHPLPEGYTHGYVPLVREALMTATHKE